MTMRSELSSAAARLDTLLARRVLCAVSGGMDSMCLLHVVLAWGRETGVEVLAAHFNHQLRGEQADRDERFVRETCKTWDVRCICGRGDTRTLAAEQGLSLEEAARVLRYQFLQETAKREDCQEILTAHHAEDNAETILLNLVRGTGLRGLAGIPPTRDHITRIFLETSRAELEAYAVSNAIPWITDETNLDPDAASRNLLRWKVLPLLRELNPRVVEHMTETARQLREIDSMLEKEVRHVADQAMVKERTVMLPLSALHVPEPVQAGVLLELFERLGVGRKDVGRIHVQALQELLLREEGQLSLPHGVTAVCRRGALCLMQTASAPERMQLSTNQPCHWGSYVLRLLDAPTGEGLTLRGDKTAIAVGACPAGARLTLPGNRGPRTVKRLCVDRGIGPMERDSLPAIYVENQLAAVWRLGVDQRFLPEGNARRFIQILKETEENEHAK